MKICLISDTHTQHNSIAIPVCDLLIHAGDFSYRGDFFETRDFLQWFAAQPATHRVFISGNHDFLQEKDPGLFQSLIPAGVTNLYDSTYEADGLTIFGSPVTPWFYDWAFNVQRGESIRRHWARIPEGVDIVVTHGPIGGILDRTTDGKNVGCYDLREFIERLQPRLFVCGHIHESAGIAQLGVTTCINASILDRQYKVKNKPVIYEL